MSMYLIIKYTYLLVCLTNSRISARGNSKEKYVIGGASAGGQLFKVGFSAKTVCCTGSGGKTLIHGVAIVYLHWPDVIIRGDVIIDGDVTYDVKMTLR